MESSRGWRGSRAPRFLALASIVAGELYGRSFPVVALTDEDFELVRRGGWARIGRGGQVDLL